MDDLVRIAESYFQRLLLDTPAEEAVPALQNEWHRRAKLYGSSALVDAERIVDTVASFFFLVGIGGHGLFFKHTAKEGVDATLGALEDAGLPSSASLLSRALSLCVPYAAKPEPLDHLRRARFVSDDPRFAELDRLIWREPADEQILAFMRAHADELLLPERGLL